MREGQGDGSRSTFSHTTHPWLPDFQPLDSLKLYLYSEHIQ